MPIGVIAKAKKDNSGFRANRRVMAESIGEEAKARRMTIITFADATYATRWTTSRRTVLKDRRINRLLIRRVRSRRQCLVLNVEVHIIDEIAPRSRYQMEAGMSRRRLWLLMESRRRSFYPLQMIKKKIKGKVRQT